MRIVALKAPANRLKEGEFPTIAHSMLSFRCLDRYGKCGKVVHEALTIKLSIALNQELHGGAVHICAGPEAQGDRT